MKNIAIVVLSIATAVFAGLYLQQSSKVAQAHTATESLQQKVGELQSAVDNQEQKTTSLRAELKQAQADTAARDAQITRLTAAAANPAQPAAIGGLAPAHAPTKPGNPGNPLSALAKMFDDPDMREAIASQQKAAMGPIIDKTYGKLFSDLKLSPDQASALKEMLLNKQLGAAQIGMSALSGDSDPSKAKDLAQKVKAASDASDAEIKAFLGDDKYAQLKTYEKSSADRMTLSGFKDQLNGSAALTADQEQQLVDAMSQARQNFKFTTDFTDKSKLAAGDVTTMFNEENVNRFIQEMDQLNQHYIEKAQNILTPDQLEAYQKFLNNQQALQKMGMQMGAKMFAPTKQSQ
jgi:hypothetical protein